MKYYLRGEAAKIAGVNIETLRYYEKNNLIPLPKRSDNGYRLYGEDTLFILEFIKDAKKAGFSLEEIKNLFATINGKEIDLKEVDRLINEKVIEIKQKIIKLHALEESLVSIKESLYEPHECPLRNAFNNVKNA